MILLAGASHVRVRGRKILARKVAGIVLQLALLGHDLTTEKEIRMNENLTTREALDTLNQKLAEALTRNQAQTVAFGTFAKNVLHRLDGLAKQADDPKVPALTGDDLAEIRQMMTTADSIGLTGLADFGVTPTGDHLPAAQVAPPEAVPVQTADGQAVQTADGQAVQTADGQAVQTADGQAVVASLSPEHGPPAPQEVQPEAGAAPPQEVQPTAEDADVGTAGSDAG